MPGKPHTRKSVQNLVEGELAHHNHLVNWSNTHECHPKRYYEPESVEELERIVADAHAKGVALLCTASHALPLTTSSLAGGGGILQTCHQEDIPHVGYEVCRPAMVRRCNSGGMKSCTTASGLSPESQPDIESRTPSQSSPLMEFCQADMGAWRGFDADVVLMAGVAAFR